jgi:hypothetical protein
VFVGADNHLPFFCPQQNPVILVLDTGISYNMATNLNILLRKISYGMNFHANPQGESHGGDE